MFLTTLQLNLEEAAGATVVLGEGVSCNAAVGTGEVLIGASTVGGKRRRKPRTQRQRQAPYWQPHVQPVVVPVVNVRVMGQGVAAQPAIGLGSWSIGIDLHPDEIAAIMWMMQEETDMPVRWLESAVSAYAREELAEDLVHSLN